MFSNRDLLADYMTRDITSFADGADYIKETIHGPLYGYNLDSPHRVLGVAHLDTVMDTPVTYDGDVIKCPQLDDRLGAFVLLEVLPALGIRLPVILCDSEEVGESTGQYFDADEFGLEGLNWLVEFDRAGTDAVTYEYSTKHWDTTIKSFGWQIGNGAFSDISYMQHVGVKAVNLGVGYHMQHSASCYADLADTELSVNRFLQLFKELGETKFEHTEVIDRWSSFRWSNAYQYSDDWADAREGYVSSYQEVKIKRDMCAACHDVMEPSWLYCPWCGFQA